MPSRDLPLQMFLFSTLRIDAIAADRRRVGRCQLVFGSPFLAEAARRSAGRRPASFQSHDCNSKSVQVIWGEKSLCER